MRHSLLLGALWLLGTAVPACDRSTSIGRAARADAAPDATQPVGNDAEPSAETLCTSSGGTVTTVSCCASQSSFPDLCRGIGTCSCSPNSSQPTTICECPTGACFMANVGCVGAMGVCTAGADATCNQSGDTAPLRGHCVTGNRCLCVEGATLSTAGKCL